MNWLVCELKVYNYQKANTRYFFIPMDFLSVEYDFQFKKLSSHHLGIDFKPQMRQLISSIP